MAAGVRTGWLPTSEEPVALWTSSADECREMAAGPFAVATWRYETARLMQLDLCGLYLLLSAKREGDGKLLILVGCWRR